MNSLHLDHGSTINILKGINKSGYRAQMERIQLRDVKSLLQKTQIVKS